MNYDFGSNSTSLEALQLLVTSEATKVQNAISNIYSTIDSMSADEVWDGEVYNAFKTKCDSYKESLDAVVAYLNGYAELVGIVKSATETLAVDIASACSVGGE